MKFLQFYKNDEAVLGLVTDKGVIDVSANAGCPKTMLELCRKGDLSGLAELTGPVLDESTLTFAPIVTGMEKMLCVGLNYRAHALECGMALPEVPTIFCKLPNALAGHNEDVPLPCGVEIDYEAELVLIMGENGKIFAATCGNDFSIREWQKATTQWLCGKSYDGFGPIGPYAVDYESLPKGGLSIQCRVNGEVRQNSRTDDLIFDEQAIVDYLMPRIPLKAGDVIFTGTPSGVMMGWPEDKKQWLKSGDVVEVTIEGIGTLKNTLK